MKRRTRVFTYLSILTIFTFISGVFFLKTETQTSIMWWALDKHIAFLKGALLCGADPNAIRKLTYYFPWEAHYTSPLIEAVDENDRVEKAKLLIEYGANVNFRGHGGMSALDKALLSDSDNLVKLLIEHGAENKGPPILWWSLEGSHFETAKYILERELEDVNAIGSNNRPIILQATIFENYQIIELLIGHGADVNAKDDNGETALMWAVHGPTTNFNIIQFLLKHGADVNAKNNNGETALMRAAHDINYDRRKLVKLLLAYGADVNTKDESGFTVLMWSLRNRSPWLNSNTIFDPNLEIPKLLIDYGADVDAEAKSGDTALMYAAGDNNPKAVRLLIDSGANTKVQNNDGYTALTKLYMFGHPGGTVAGDPLRTFMSEDKQEIVRALLKHGVNVNIQVHNGETALMRASENGDLEMVRLLLDHGADTGVTDKDGWNAIRRASHRGDAEMVKVLLAGSGSRLE